MVDHHVMTLPCSCERQVDKGLRTNTHDRRGETGHNEDQADGVRS